MKTKIVRYVCVDLIAQSSRIAVSRRNALENSISIVTFDRSIDCLPEIPMHKPRSRSGKSSKKLSDKFKGWFSLLERFVELAVKISTIVKFLLMITS